MFSKTNHITKFFRIKIHFYPGARKTPPPAIRSVRDLIYWQYAKIIADSAGMGKRNYRFVMNRFKKLQGEEKDLLITELDDASFYKFVAELGSCLKTAGGKVTH